MALYSKQNIPYMHLGGCVKFTPQSQNTHLPKTDINEILVEFINNPSISRSVVIKDIDQDLLAPPAMYGPGLWP